MGGDGEGDKREDKEEESYIEPILLSTRRGNPAVGARLRAHGRRPSCL